MALNKVEKEYMLHAIGYDCRGSRNCRSYRGRKYYYPYRNGFDAGAISKIWEGLCERGLAKTNDHKHYHVTIKGLSELSESIGVHIYSEYSYCIGDAKTIVLHTIMDSCSGINSYPVTSRNIAEKNRIPVKLVRETANYLIEQGLIQRIHFGGCDEDGNPWCIHGYGLTQKSLKDPYFINADKKALDEIIEMLKK